MSVLKARWVNRGFMRGPFLPIYGSGAIVVLVFTLPFRTNAVRVFFAGMICYNTGIFYRCGDGKIVSCALLGL